MTTYCVAYRLHNSAAERTASFDSMLARALFVISLTPYGDVLREWLS